MKTKFTPGPWKHQARPGGWDGVYAGGQLLCSIALNVPENATLMAAAPELYEALEALTKNVDDDGAGHVLMVDLAHAKEVLKKARGES